MRIKKIYWTPYLRAKFEEYKTGKLVVEKYYGGNLDLEFICFPPLTVTRFLTMMGSEHYECYPEPEQPPRTHETAMKEFESYLNVKEVDKIYIK